MALSVSQVKRGPGVVSTKHTYSDLLLVVGGAADGATALLGLHEPLKRLQARTMVHVRAAEQHLAAAVETLHADRTVGVPTTRHAPLDALPLEVLEGIGRGSWSRGQATGLGHGERYLLGAGKEVATGITDGGGRRAGSLAARTHVGRRGAAATARRCGVRAGKMYSFAVPRRPFLYTYEGVRQGRSRFNS